jgi:hypothetical protein
LVTGRHNRRAYHRPNRECLFQTKRSIVRFPGVQ